LKAALDVQPQHVQVVALQKQATHVGLHVSVALSACWGGWVFVASARLYLASHGLHAVEHKITVVGCGAAAWMAQAQPPVRKWLEQHGEGRGRRVLGQGNGLGVSNTAMHVLLGQVLCLVTSSGWWRTSSLLLDLVGPNPKLRVGGASRT